MRLGLLTLVARALLRPLLYGTLALHDASSASFPPAFRYISDRRSSEMMSSQFEPLASDLVTVARGTGLNGLVTKQGRGRAGGALVEAAWGSG
jgi:hypothetical protein